MALLCPPENGSSLLTNMAAAIFDFHRYFISSEITGGILVKWIPLNVQMSPPENDSGPLTNMAEQQPSLKSLIALYFNSVTISLSHLLHDHWSDVF